MFHWPTPFKIILVLSSFHPGVAIACSPCLHGSRYISGGPLRGTGLYGKCTGASRWGLWFPLGDQVGLTGCDLRPLGRLYPHQMGAFVELPLPGHHTVLITAPLYPCGAFSQPLQLDPGSSKELLLHVRHVLEGVIFFYAPSLLLEWEEVVKDLVPYPTPLGLLKGGEVVPVVCLKNQVQVLSPPLTSKLGHMP